MVIIYLNYLESRMCMNTSNLFMQKSKSGLMSIRSALSDCKILFEMFLYFSTSDLRYFFFLICISFKYAFSDLLQIDSNFGLLMHDITSKVPKLATRLSHILPRGLGMLFVIISYYTVCIFISQTHISKVSQTLLTYRELDP